MGDEKQLGGVEAGKPFELLQKNGMPTVDMRQIQRQKRHELLAGVYMAAYGKIDASFKLLDDKIIEAPGREAETAARLWGTFTPERRDDTLVVCQSNAVRNRMNAEMRAQLKSEGAVDGPEITQDVLLSNHLTKEDLRLAQFYVAGDRILFRQRRGVKRLGIKSGDMLTVRAANADKGVVALENDKGEKKEWIPADMPRAEDGALESFRPAELKLQAGDRVKWTRSDSQRGFRTNEAADIISVDENRIVMRLPTGETLDLARDDPMASALDYAYAMTADEAQGKDRENGIGVIDSKEKSLTSRRRFYIQISRSESDLTLVVDDKEAAQKQIERFKGDKTSALEITEASKDDLGKALETEQSGVEAPAQEPDPQLDLEIDRS